MDMDKKTELKELKNLGAASVNILQSIGIQTLEDLRKTGSVNAYLKIKARGIKVSKVMLYALEGALLDIHWKELDNDIKSRLLAETEQKQAETAL